MGKSTCTNMARFGTTISVSRGDQPALYYDSSGRPANRLAQLEQSQFLASQLIDATEAGQLGVVREMLANGVDVNGGMLPNGVGDRDKGDTALIVACARGHTEMVRLLLD